MFIVQRGNQRFHRLGILKQRYARGEIPKAEYERVRRDLEA